MELQEIIDGCNTLAEKVGPKAEVNVDVSNCQGLHGSLYTKGIASNRDDVAAFSVYIHNADGYAALLVGLEREWLRERDKRAGRITEQVALEIIRVTAEFGECTDAALRAKFGPNFTEYADAAIERANEMAANGPFSIVEMRGANAA